MILSVDTGLNNYGLVVLDKTGTIHQTKVIQSKATKGIKVSTDYEARIGSIFQGIDQMLTMYPITQITGEMPSFGAQSSKAAISLTAGATIIVGVSTLRNIPTIWATPREIKLHFTGNPNASKQLIMQRCCKMYNWDITYKEIRAKKTRKLLRKDATYHVMGNKLTAGYFEHIADAIAAYHTCKGKINAN